MYLTKEALNKLEEDALKISDNIELGMLFDDGVEISREKYKAFREIMNHEQRLELINELRRQKMKVPSKDLEDDYKISDNINLGLLLDGKRELLFKNELNIFQNEMNHKQRLAFIETVKRRKGLNK